MHREGIISTYRKILDGTMRSFPKGTWNDKDNAVAVVKYMIEDKLGWSREEICTNLCHHTFIEHKLRGMVNICFSGSPYAALNAVYPGEYRMWELKSSPQNTWDTENTVEAIKWLIEEKLKWSIEEVRDNININVFIENGLQGMMQAQFTCSTYDALETAYPSVYKPWELKRMPKNLWNKELGIEATKWLIEDKLMWSREEVCLFLTQYVFLDHGLRTMLVLCFDDSPYNALNAAYPGQYLPWELRKVPKNFWTIETGIKATKWLVEDILKISSEEAIKTVTRRTFINHRLSGMLHACFADSSKLALQATYGEN